MKFIASATQYLEFEHQSEYATVNGKTLLLPIPVYMRDGVCMVPYAVISRLIDGGLTFKRDAAEHIITISRVGYYEEDRWICDELSFTDKDFDVFSAVQSIPAAPYEYSIDISEYLAYIDPADTAPYLILANREHAITEDPKNLTDIPAKWTGASSSTKDYKMDAGATQALIAMMSAMEADGVKDVFVTSAYRSYERQAALFAQYVSEEMAEHGCSREEAEALVLEYSARPGTSEHQTGLCIDFMTNGMKELNNEFENTAAFRWLSENAHQYGFILRYPAHKTDIVGYSYESWHYRFVGKTIACEIYEKDLTLEEYLKK